MTAPTLGTLVHTILDTHHALLHRELPRLEEALKDATPRLTAPFAHLRRALEDHLRREELVLFPALLEYADGRRPDVDVAALVAAHEADHDTLRTLEDALRQAARDAGPLEGEILAMLDDLVEHLSLEESELHPLALRVVPPKDVDVAPIPEPTPDEADPVPAGCGASAGTTAPPHAHKHDNAARLVRSTHGVCPTCHAEVPAAVVVRDGEVRLEKTCPTDGMSFQLLSRNPDYWADLDRFYFAVNDESWAQRDYIVRMTEKCNLACPICLAKANTEDTPDLDLGGLQELLTQRRGIKVDLMAAEPTLREDLEDIVRKVKAAGSIAALHTNGLKLADLDYARKIKAAGVDEVFLQFDGLDDTANKVLRGRPLAKARQQALQNMRTLDIATSLIVVVARNLNEPQVGDMLRLALKPENDHIREVFYLGLRLMGSAKKAGTFEDQQLMPDDTIGLLCDQEPRITREDVKHFNMLYFSMLSAFHVKKCLYVQHYLVSRDGQGGFDTAADIFDLEGLARAASKYAAMRKDHPALARFSLGMALAGQGLRPKARKHAKDFVQLERLFQRGMNLKEVPRKILLLGFITACDEHNFDAQVAINCGKGELSMDGGFTESSAVANIRREARFSETDRTPGRAFGKPA